MDTALRKEHWENVFITKDTSKVSWHQSVPETSLAVIDKLNLAKDAKIIEVGSGDSYLGDHLLVRDYKNITLLDISEKALQTIRERMGHTASEVEFLAKDITEWSAAGEFDLWHDRAVFHFLTDKSDINGYVQNAASSVVEGGYLIMGTFSDNGPDMCSGLKVQQYNEEQLTHTFFPFFKKVECFRENHTTPSGGVQNFLFCIFKRIKK